VIPHDGEITDIICVDYNETHNHSSLITSCTDGMIRWFNFLNGVFHLEFTLKIPTGHCTKLLKFNNEIVTIATSEGELYHWDLFSKVMDRKTQKSNNNSKITSLSSSSHLITTGNSNGKIKFYNLYENYKKEKWIEVNKSVDSMISFGIGVLTLIVTSSASHGAATLVEAGPLTLPS